MGPGSAAHRNSASKTRVNALMALRRVRGTPAQNKTAGDAPAVSNHNRSRRIRPQP
jgi:hypothetical protein